MASAMTHQAITIEDIETLKALNASYPGTTYFNKKEEKPILPVVYVKNSVKEWERRSEVKTFEDLWAIAWANDHVNILWLHDGVGLAISTCVFHARSETSISARTHDLTVISGKREYRLPANESLSFTMEDLSIPEYILAYLNSRT